MITDATADLALLAKRVAATSGPVTGNWRADWRRVVTQKLPNRNSIHLFAIEFDRENS